MHVLPWRTPSPWLDALSLLAEKPAGSAYLRNLLLACSTRRAQGSLERKGLIRPCLLAPRLVKVCTATVSMADISSFTYEPLKVDQVRWYWNKQPFNLKGVLATPL